METRMTRLSERGNNSWPPQHFGSGGRLWQRCPVRRHGGDRTGPEIWSKSFDFGAREVAHWFPGHMAKGLKQMRANLKSVDCIIEIHDARIPFSGRNPAFQETLDVKPHVLILNKMDLADVSKEQIILKKLKRNGVKNVLFTDCLKQRDDNVKKLVPMVVDRNK
ncbi:Mitochondrial ribosome-associated GTPase 1 [Dissostichus eleginoides]|uniref:Mitochondrial ribosome-associated GTPase 1 n=1 Tax=Dissostichus eleginoides TaxID=100907 RepID=A0AAD9F2U9_DISEL|nr:Mitochondrial ribosome-associated GTPase 1 [Dissostichus eleginoides]